MVDAIHVPEPKDLKPQNIRKRRARGCPTWELPVQISESLGDERDRM
jgi:hypothetical protein